MQISFVAAMAALPLALLAPGQGTASGLTSRSATGPTIAVDVRSDHGQAPTHLLGANHHYTNDGYGAWDPSRDEPVAITVREARRAGISSLRFPGGTIANLYDWKRAIGPDHGCQVIGPHARTPARRLTTRLSFGPDEFMRYADAVHAVPVFMQPFMTETPEDAADWVEYMNAPSGTSTNPHGGVAWADVRAANGHPAPYQVHWWEIGNEPDHGYSRYWMSRRVHTRLHQYLFGGSRVFQGEPLGKNCSHPAHGVASDGSADQTFDVLYPPVAPESLQVSGDGASWTRVDDLSTKGPDAHVYTLDASTGRLSFGDGVHGAIPTSGRALRATYRSVHEGYFTFVREMKEVDPSIRTCATWDTQLFQHYMRDHHLGYDCLSDHAIFTFRHGSDPHPVWRGALQGHDLTMLRSAIVRDRVMRVRALMPSHTPMILTEFVEMHGDSKAYPAWSVASTHAVYMASLWAAWLKMRIPLGDGDDFTWNGNRAVLGPPPSYTFTADALTRQALSPMFSDGGVVLHTDVGRNVVRRPPGEHDSYPALVAAATRVNGGVWLMVVNRLPTRSVTATIRLTGGRASGQTSISAVYGASYRSWNRPDRPPSVTLHRRTASIRATGFRHLFQAASTTVFWIPLR
jgi:alpha-N-arabinofuranosidase